jgi:3-methyladenine DNA glycosylase AlkD
LTPHEKRLKELADPVRAANLARYFKTGKGGYGEGDLFLGVRVPEVRKVAREFSDTSLEELARLIKSKYHEVRFLALVLLVSKFNKSKSSATRKELFEFYLEQLADNRVNNWDLVDSTAPYLGKYLIGNPKSESLLIRLAKSSSLFEQRASIMFTFAFLREKQISPTRKIATSLLSHEHDLIHKAVGWALREMGQVDKKALEHFLELHVKTMPRQMLRYAIEKLPEAQRKSWLRK